TEVLRDFTLDVPAGRFVAIIGPSGVGKSTLLRVIAGLLPPTTGRVTIRTRRDDRRLPVAMVFQDARLLPWRKVASNVAFGLEHGRFGADERHEKAEAALARALAVEPDILLMDEPFAALDAITRELQGELARIHAATGKTILFVTHS